MHWHDLLFMHWPVAAEALREQIPEPLTIDTFEGPGRSVSAWLGVIPFRMSGVRHRLLPPLPLVSAFPELNVRTYVSGPGDDDSGGRPKPGVWFFSLDAASPIAVKVARATFHLAYMEARMECQACHGWIEYTSRRTRRQAPPAAYRARYRPTGEAAPSAPGTLEHFLTERYCLYAADQLGRVYRGEIHHEPWGLQPAECDCALNTMAAPLGVSLPAVETESGPPLLHYARRLEVVAWLPRRVA